MSALDVFAYGDSEVRVITSDGEPWFVAADVARLLGYGHTPHAVRLLDDDMKGVLGVGTPGGDQQMIVISEPGLYRLIMRSQRPEARAIECWAATEVLPAIRLVELHKRLAPSTAVVPADGVQADGARAAS